jgi:hypothetical protein
MASYQDDDGDLYAEALGPALSGLARIEQVSTDPPSLSNRLGHAERRPGHHPREQGRATQAVRAACHLP